MAIQDSLQDAERSREKCNDMISITGDAFGTSAASHSKRSYSLTSPTSHDRSYSCSDAGRRTDVLVTGHKLSKPKTHSHSQFVGHNHRSMPREDPYHSSNPPSNDNFVLPSVSRSHRKRHSTTSSSRANTNLGPLFELPHHEDSNTLPSSIRQLLDSDERLGTNV